MNASADPTPGSPTATPRTEADTLGRTLRHFATALHWLGTCIGVPASLVGAMTLYDLLAVPGTPQVQYGRMATLLMFGGAMLLGFVLSLGRHLVMAQALRLETRHS